MALWVVLMVPLTVLAALIAMSVPLRLKAETSMRSATEDLAALLNKHVQNCNARPTDNGTPPDPAPPPDPDCLEVSLTSLCDEEDVNKRLCGEIDLVMRDLGTAGVDVDSLQGFYVHDVNNKADTAPARDRRDVTSQTPGLILCRRGTVTSDDPSDPSLYVALVGDWSNGGWAPSQVWPDGRSVAGEAVRSERLTASASTSRCRPGAVDVDPGTLARDGTVTG